MAQPDWLSTNSVADYVSAVLRLIDNDAERVEIARRNANYDYDAGMMVAPDSACGPFGETVLAVYRHHEKFQAQNVKAFTLGMQSDFSSAN